jgi:3-isopropylmalate/(R)-2-methylmalate dehydratase large subunit
MTIPTSQPRTLFQKIWDSHIVAQDTPSSPAILYIDLHLIHEVTSPQAFAGLKAPTAPGRTTLPVRRPDRTAATIDHAIPTRAAHSAVGSSKNPPLIKGTGESRMDFADELCRKQIEQLIANCQEWNIPLYGLESPYQGIVHIIGPELGLTQPGLTIVCGDSHTATHGAFGALAFGIGTSEVEHVLASQCLLQRQPKTCQVQVTGKLGFDVTAKDIILALIAQVGVSGGQGYVFEYCGDTIRSLNMDERMTVCNMSIEAGARAGMIAPDETTYAYLSKTPLGLDAVNFERLLKRWRELPSDEGAVFDKTILLDVSRLEPMITFGTNPGMAMPVSGRLPKPEDSPDPIQRKALEKALAYMDLQPGHELLGQPLDVVFIGSCTNGRIDDLRQAAEMLKQRHIAPGLRMLVVPGSQQVKRQAEAEGLHRIFIQAGAEWREPGCSMCIAMNGDQLEPGQYAVSTSNRNFEGRQGKGGRTFLASPVTAAACAVTGKVTDPRRLE